MALFFLMLQNLIPLYALIALGWMAGRYFGVDRQSLGAMAINIAMPAVAFGFILRLDLNFVYLGLPLIVFAVLFALSFGWYYVGKRIYGDQRANLLSMTAVSANTGYMGVPVVLALFDEQAVAVYIFLILGGIFHEATTMYYLAARSHYTVRDSLIKLAKFPVLYAVILAVALNLCGFKMPLLMETYWAYFKGAYVIIGMMIIGAALSKVQKLVIAPKFLALTFFGQFILWPVTAFCLIILDRTFFHLYDAQIHKLLFVMSLMPPAANIAAFAVQLDLNPEKAATTILLGTLMALITIPLTLALSGLFN